MPKVAPERKMTANGNSSFAFKVPSTQKRRSSSIQKPKAIYLTDRKFFDSVFGPEEKDDFSRLLDIGREPLEKKDIVNNPELLQDVELIISSWGMPVMDESFLAAAPRLRAIFYAAGSIRAFVTPAFWRRNIVVTSAYAVNAMPVSEYTLGVILLGLKRFWSFARSVKNETDLWQNHNRLVSGGYRSTVGLVSCGMIGRRVIQLLKPFDVTCKVYDPYLKEEDAIAMGVELCSLKELFERSDVVSIHTPLVPETQGLIGGTLISTMKSGATLINTSRGGILRTSEMTEVLTTRDDITAILDVFDPEPPEPGTPLIHLPNVVVTPHIAGSVALECRRLGLCMVEELRRYLAGQPLLWNITQNQSIKLA